MKYYYNLFLSESLAKKKAELIRKLDSDVWQINKYLVVLTRNENNHLEFYDSVFVLKNMVEKEDLFIVGIADGYPGALEMVKCITEEVYGATGGTDIRGYLLTKQREYEESNV